MSEEKSALQKKIEAAKIPNWVKEYVRSLERERQTALNALNEYIDNQTPAPFFMKIKIGKNYFEVDEVMPGTPAIYFANSFKNAGHFFDGRDKKSITSPIRKSYVVIIARPIEEIIMKENETPIMEEVKDTPIENGESSHYHKQETDVGDDVFDGPAEECPFCE